MAFFDSAAYAVIGPITFIIINYASCRYHLVPAMECEERRKNLGTIYFPVSLLILVILSFNGILPLYAAGTGILVMGYGDGLASLFGEQYGKWNFPIWGSRKSYVGTSVMFTATAAALGGALSIGSLYLAGSVILFGWSSELLTGMAVVTSAGVFGSLVDSFLGAFVQIHYYDTAKKRLTEYSERNGQFLEAVQGVRWMDNDAVNFFCTLSAAAAAGAAYLILC